MKKSIIFITVLGILLSAAKPADALLLNSDKWNYALDLPEDFTMTDGNGNDRYQFASSVLPVDLVISTYERKRYDNAEKALDDVISKLKGSGESTFLYWRNRECAVSSVELNFAKDAKYIGWAVSLELPYEKGWYVMLGFYPDNLDENTAMICETEVISALDSVCTDTSSFYESGPMTSFVYPREKPKQIQLEIAGKKIDTTIDEIDGEANQYVIEREFTILVNQSQYGIAQAASERFYRIVYRDAYRRLRKVSFDVQNELTFGEGAISDRFELAQTLLQWTQGFEYERDLLGSDFTSLPDLICGKGGDCDSRSMLLAVMLRNMNYDTVFFVSAAYSHAMIGIALKADGAAITAGGISYLLGETTAKVKLGQVAQEMSDSSKWVPVFFPQDMGSR